MARDQHIEHLSLAALYMAASGLPAQSELIAQWLYRFGTVPRGVDIIRNFGPDDDPLAVLGLTVGGKSRRILETTYQATSFASWYSFTHNSIRRQLTPACKLYVSPRPEALAGAFPLIVEQFVRYEVQSFKVGRGVEGLLRPDKIIAYFEDSMHMESVACELERSLEGFPVQGVPFTSDNGGNGMLSTGVDPPPVFGAESWRSWVTKRLANSLASRHASTCADPVAAALAEIRIAGVNPHKWRPEIKAFWLA